MRSSRVLLLPAFLSIATVAPAQSPSKILDLIPARAEAVAFFPKPKRLESKWSALTGVFGEKGSFLGLKGETGIEPAGPGAIVKVILPKGEGGEAWAWLVPAAQPRELLRGLKPKALAGGWTWSAPVDTTKKAAKVQAATTLHGAAKAGFLVVANSAAALAAVLKPEGSLAAELAPFAAWMEGHDACLVATRAGVEQAAREGGSNLKDKPAVSAGEPAAAAPKPPKRIQAKLEGWLELAKTSVHHVLAGLDLTEDGGLRFEARALITKGSSLARELESLAPAGAHPLSGLSASGFALALGGEWSSLFDVQAAVFEDLDRAGKVQEATKARLQKALEAQNRQIRSWGMALAAPRAGQPMLSGFTALVRVADSRTYLAAAEEAAKAQGALFDELGMAGAVTFTKDSVAGIPSCTVSTRIAGKPEDPSTAQISQGLAMAFGGDAILASTAALDEQRMLVVLGGPEQLKARVEEARKAPDRLPASIATVEPDLGSGHRFALYLDLRGLRDLAQLAAGMFMGPDARPLPAIPEVPAMGISLSLEPTALELRGSLRGATLRAAAEFFKAVKTLLPADRKGAGKP